MDVASLTDVSWSEPHHQGTCQNKSFWVKLGGLSIPGCASTGTHRPKDTSSKGHVVPRDRTSVWGHTGRGWANIAPLLLIGKEKLGWRNWQLRKDPIRISKLTGTEKWDFCTIPYYLGWQRRIMFLGGMKINWGNWAHWRLFSRERKKFDNLEIPIVILDGMKLSKNHFKLLSY